MDTRRPALGERRVVRHIAPVSAAKIAAAIAATLVAVILVGLLALYLLGAVSGALRSVEGFIVSFGISDADTYRFSFLKFLPWFLLVSALFCGVTSGIAAISAVIYNIVSEIVGGVEVVTRER